MKLGKNSTEILIFHSTQKIAGLKDRHFLHEVSLRFEYQV